MKRSASLRAIRASLLAFAMVTSLVPGAWGQESNTPSPSSQLYVVVKPEATLQVQTLADLPSDETSKSGFLFRVMAKVRLRPGGVAQLRLVKWNSGLTTPQLLSWGDNLEEMVEAESDAITNPAIARLSRSGSYNMTVFFSRLPVGILPLKLELVSSDSSFAPAEAEIFSAQNNPEINWRNEK